MLAVNFTLHFLHVEGATTLVRLHDELDRETLSPELQKEVEATALGNGRLTFSCAQTAEKSTVVKIKGDQVDPYELADFLAVAMKRSPYVPSPITFEVGSVGSGQGECGGMAMVVTRTSTRSIILHEWSENEKEYEDWLSSPIEDLQAQVDKLIAMKGVPTLDALLRQMVARGHIDPCVRALIARTTYQTTHA